jgi:hypothetical protein
MSGNPHTETTMKTIALVVASLCIAGTALAQNAPAPAPAAPAAAPASGADAGAACQTQIGPKNLHGAALTSSTKKCCTDAAKADKLHGAARTSFVKKCVSSAMPAPAPKT